MTTTHHIGSIRGEGTLSVEIHLGPDPLNKHAGKGKRSTRHHLVYTEPTQLCITGTLLHRGHTEACGQITGTLLRLTSLAGDWTVGDVLSLHTIWARWHLNTMRAACAHMPPDAGVTWRTGDDVVCPESGYRYGSAWLVEYLPIDVMTEVRRLQGLGS